MASINELLAAHEYKYGRPAIKNTLFESIGNAIADRQARIDEERKAQRDQQMDINLLAKKFEYEQQQEVEKQKRVAEENTRQNAIFEQMSGMDNRTAAGDAQRVVEGGKSKELERKARVITSVKRVIKDGKVSTEVIDEIKPEDEPKPLSPILQNAKDKRLEDVVMTVQDYNVKRDTLSDAVNAIGRIEGGRYGAVNRLRMRELDPNNPALEDWQKLKIVLLDETLANTIKTKGAISDKEMELFQKAAANDDVMSIRSVMPVLRRALKKMNAEESAKVVSYRNLYNEDPYQLQGVQSNIDTYRDMFNEAQTTPKKSVNVEIKDVRTWVTSPTGVRYRVVQ